MAKIGADAKLPRLRQAASAPGATAGVTSTTSALSTSPLRNDIKAWDVWRNLPGTVRDQLTLTHLQKVAAIPDSTARARLAHEAVRDGVGVREIEQRVAAYKTSTRVGKKCGAGASAARAAWRRGFASSVPDLGGRCGRWGVVGCVRQGR